ncbi:mast cell protease 1A [Amia ocellicauda]|uniref:mast cell protease 1A n=1 Tax=Amia ocellicauda TaxID=2972642 RepID=UPI0034639276
MGNLLGLATLLLLLPTLTSAGRVRDGIIGGNVATAHSRPYMGYMVVQHCLEEEEIPENCGVFLLREDFVMTAAHCNGRKLTVLLGVHDILKKEPSRQTFLIKERFPHPEFCEESLINDIMLLKLPRNATLNKYVKTIPLPAKSEDVKENSMCLVSGWGSTSPDGENNPQELQEVNVTVISRETCREDWNEHITKYRLCTKGGVGPCVGDSGSPLVCNGVAQGVVSFSTDPCNMNDFPHVYTRISHYLPWINKVMGTH